MPSAGYQLFKINFAPSAQKVFLVFSFVCHVSAFCSLSQFISMLFRGLLLTDADCQRIPPPRHGSVTFRHGHNFSSVAQFACNHGYKLNDGDIEQVCLLNSTWSGRTPRCQGKGRHLFLWFICASCVGHLETFY